MMPDNQENAEQIPLELFSKLSGESQDSTSLSTVVDMNTVIKNNHILFICLDTLRWDVAFKEQENGGTPILNRYGKWVKSFAPGNFTYPSHHTMFIGFLPAPVEARSIGDRELLFFPKDIGMGRGGPTNAFGYEGANIMEGLEKVGYRTICIGGVAFFDKRTPIGSVFPNMFRESYWRPSFGCGVKESAKNQIDFTIKLLNDAPKDEKLFVYLNLTAIHYPNAHYLEGVKRDNTETHAAALRYVDTELERLFDAFKQNRETFVIALSDHGSCYGENGFQFHGLPNDIVDTVPYKHFFL